MSGVTLVVARGRDDQPLGFALSRMASDEAELLLLAVSPEHRRLGVGRRLLDDFVQRSHALGARRVHLEVRDGNPAVEMYSGAGFTSAGRRRNYYRGQDGSQFDAITLTRDI
jgi:ribosomal-protein-alanine N-acetyltransferase